MNILCSIEMNTLQKCIISLQLPLSTKTVISYCLVWQSLIYSLPVKISKDFSGRKFLYLNYFFPLELESETCRSQKSSLCWTNEESAVNINSLSLSNIQSLDGSN